MQSAARADLFHLVTGKGTPLLLIHGTGADADGFRQAAEHLSRRRRVITYDRRGFSRSPGTHPRRGYMRQHAEDAVALLDRLGIQRAAVCGWSGGGVIALELAAAHPGRVSSLVLYEPPFQAGRQLSPKVMVGFARTLMWRALGRKRDAAAAFFSTVAGRDWDLMPASARERLLNNSDGVMAELDGGTGEHLDAATLSRYSGPLTVFLGSDSPPFFGKCADRLCQLVPRTTLIRIPGAGHAMPVVQPMAFADVLDRALGPA